MDIPESKAAAGRDTTSRPARGRYAFAWLGTAAALGFALFVLRLTAHPLLLASLGGSCVILFGMPDNEMAQPRSFIGGHVISATVAMLFLHFGQMQFGGSSEIWAIAAVATALVLMMLTRTIHSPAGANPIVVFAEQAPWSFFLSPLLVGLIVLMVVALLVNNRRGAGRFPRTWR